MRLIARLPKKTVRRKPTKRHSREPIDTPRGLWKLIQAEGGLDAGFYQEMDGEIISALEGYLGDGHKSMTEIVRDPTLTIERLVEGLLRALGPFSAMLDDLLQLMARIGASSTDHALAV